MATTKKRPTTGKNQEEYLYGLGPIPAERIRLERERVRIHKRMLRLRSYELPYPDVVRSLEAALVNLDEAIALLRVVSKTWRPAPGVLGLTPLEEGSQVTIRPAFVERYRELFNVAEPLRVQKVLSGRVSVQTNEGTMLIPRIHVQVEG